MYLLGFLLLLVGGQTTRALHRRRSFRVHALTAELTLVTVQEAQRTSLALAKRRRPHKSEVAFECSNSSGAERLVREAAKTDFTRTYLLNHSLVSAELLVHVLDLGDEHVDGLGFVSLTDLFNDVFAVLLDLLGLLNWLVLVYYIVFRSIHLCFLDEVLVNARVG